MKKNKILLYILILFIINSFIVNIGHALQIEPQLISIAENIIDEGKATYQITSNDMDMQGRVLFNKTNPLLIETVEEIQTLDIQITKLGDNHPSYAGSVTFNPSNNQNIVIFLEKIGTLRVTMKDLRFDDVIRVTCNNSYADTGMFVVDDTKIFETNRAPISECQIRATYSGGIQEKSVNIEEGKLTELYLDIENENQSSYAYIFALLIVIIILTALGLRQYLSNVNNAEDPFRFLSSDKRKIIDFLKKHDAVNQSKIIYECKIPKTTLARILNDLEAKNIIEIEKIGKAKRIKLKNRFKD